MGRSLGWILPEQSEDFKSFRGQNFSKTKKNEGLWRKEDTYHNKTSYPVEVCSLVDMSNNDRLCNCGSNDHIHRYPFCTHLHLQGTTKKLR